MLRPGLGYFGIVSATIAEIPMKLDQLIRRIDKISLQRESLFLDRRHCGRQND
jgi:hypothetical protein